MMGFGSYHCGRDLHQTTEITSYSYSDAFSVRPKEATGVKECGCFKVVNTTRYDSDGSVYNTAIDIETTHFLCPEHMQAHEAEKDLQGEIQRIERAQLEEQERIRKEKEYQADITMEERFKRAAPAAGIELQMLREKMCGLSLKRLCDLKVQFSGSWNCTMHRGYVSMTFTAEHSNFCPVKSEPLPDSSPALGRWKVCGCCLSLTDVKFYHFKVGSKYKFSETQLGCSATRSSMAQPRSASSNQLLENLLNSPVKKKIKMMKAEEETENWSAQSETQRSNCNDCKTELSVMGQRSVSRTEENGSQQTSALQTKKERKSLDEIENEYTKKAASAFIVSTTSMCKKDQMLVALAVKNLSSTYINWQEMTKDTTHVVVGTPRRTVTLLKAIAWGCQIVSLDWVTDSVDNYKWLPERDFAFMCAELPILKLSRSVLYFLASKLFITSVGVIYVEENTKPLKRDIVELISSCGGQVTESKSIANMCVGGIDSSHFNNVTELWVLDSICMLQLQNTSDYRISY